MHISAFEHKNGQPVEHKNGQPVVGDEVSYVLARDKKKRLSAEQAMAVNRHLFARRAQLNAGPLMAGLALFSVMLAGLVVGDVPDVIWLLCIVINFCAFLAYLKDKAVALSNKRRVREDHLHTLALVGGWPGALCAQQILRHKTSKRSFQITFWLMAILNCCAIWGYAYFGA